MESIYPIDIISLRNVVCYISKSLWERQTTWYSVKNEPIKYYGLIQTTWWFVLIAE